MDEQTRQEIRRLAADTLRDAGISEPPLPIEDLLEHLDLYRDYYDLSNPGFLDRAKHRLQIQGRKLVDVLNKVRLQAVLLFDEKRICIDGDLPTIKRPWASCHEAGHRILTWHQPYFYADTAETLDPAWQERLEQEANYAAARLLFLGNRFSRDAHDVSPTIEGVKLLAKQYGRSLTTTLRRYVEQGPNRSMAMLVSTPPWSAQPADQAHRWRYFEQSEKFRQVFPSVGADALRLVVDKNVRPHRGGLVGDFEFALTDIGGEPQPMRGWSFNNQHYLLTLFFEDRPTLETRIPVLQRLTRH